MTVGYTKEYTSAMAKDLPQGLSVILNQRILNLAENFDFKFTRRAQDNFLTVCCGD